MKNWFGIAVAIVLLVAPTVGAFSLKAPRVPPVAVEDPRESLEPWSKIVLLTDIADAELSGQLLLEGTASARTGFVLRSVEIFLDRQWVGRAEGTESWSYLLDTTTLLDGGHHLQAIAWAAPSAPVSVVSTGSVVDVVFRTLNHVTGILLFEHSYVMTGASPESWTHVLDRDYTNLRVTLETTAGSRLESAAPRGDFVLAHVDAGDDSETAARHVWVSSWGAPGVSAVVHHGEATTLREGSVLALAGAFAGDGRVTLRVEGLPAATPAAE